jgi:hypothetical protein
MKNGKKSNFTIPQEKNLTLKKKQIENTSTQYISKTSQYVKPFSRRKLQNNDIESKKNNI